MSMIQSSRRHNYGGFTLIELLVVIAIIAILAAILFPVFVRAKEGGRRTQCISNLRQIGLAIQTYRQDWDGFMYFENYPYGNSDSTNWIERHKSYTKNVRIFQCPSDAMFGFKRPVNSAFYFPHTCSYAYNGHDIFGAAKPRNPDSEDSRYTRVQAYWTVTDIRYYPQFPGQPGIFSWEAGYTATAHGYTYWDGGKTSESGVYIKDLASVRLYADGHARFCKGWQRFGDKDMP